MKAQGGGVNHRPMKKRGTMGAALPVLISATENCNYDSRVSYVILVTMAVASIRASVVDCGMVIGCTIRVTRLMRVSEMDY